MMLAALIYAIVSLAVGCAYVGFFRAFDETPIETACRAAFVGLFDPVDGIDAGVLMDEGDGKPITRSEVLRRRAQLHLDRAVEYAKHKGKASKILARNELLMAERCQRKFEREVARAACANGRRRRAKTLHDLGLGERILGRLATAGIITLEKLLQCPPQRLELIPNLGKPSVKKLEASLAVHGLALPELRYGEVVRPTKVMADRPKRKTPHSVEMAAKRARIVKLLSEGVSQRQVNVQIGNAPGAHWAAGNVIRKIRRDLAAGFQPEAIAAELGLEGDAGVVAYLKRIKAEN